MNLSSHFTLAEMCRTEVRHLQDVNASEALGYLAPLRELCAVILEPLRLHFGPVVIHSGFRMPALNSYVDGSKTSQHMKGEAADFHAVGVSLETVFDWLRTHELFESRRIGQVILEGHAAGKPTWVHVSLGVPWRPYKDCAEARGFDGAHYTRVG